jgi:hypothetical protein
VIKACETARKKAAKARRQKGDDGLMMAASLWEGGRGGEVGHVRERGVVLEGSTIKANKHKPQAHRVMTRKDKTRTQAIA